MDLEKSIVSNDESKFINIFNFIKLCEIDGNVKSVFIEEILYIDKEKFDDKV